MTFNLEDYRLSRDVKMAPPKYKKVRRHKPGMNFLRGPIPLDWLTRATSLQGRALHVALALWFLAGVRKTWSVPLSNETAELFGVQRYAKYRALTALERAGLVTIQKKQGRSPIVTLLDIEEDHP